MFYPENSSNKLYVIMQHSPGRNYYYIKRKFGLMTPDACVVVTAVNLIQEPMHVSYLITQENLISYRVIFPVIKCKTSYILIF